MFRPSVAGAPPRARRTSLAAGLALAVILTAPSCRSDPTRPELQVSPVFRQPSWSEVRREPAHLASEKLAAVLDDEGVPTRLRMRGSLFLVSEPLDENGSGRIEALIRMVRAEDEDRVARVRRTNQLVWHEKEYRFLTVSVGFWRQSADRRGTHTPGFRLLSPSEAAAARRGEAGLKLVRFEPAMTWDEIQPIPEVSELLDEFGVEGKRDRLAGRVVMKRDGVLLPFLESNQDTRFRIEFDVPLDLLREVIDEDETIFVELSLAKQFLKSPRQEALPLRGTLAVRNPVLDGKRVLDPELRAFSTDRYYGDQLTKADLQALIAARRTLLDRLEAMLAAGQRDSEEWKAAFRALQRLQVDVGSCLLEVWPRALATLLPAMEAIEEVQPGTLLPEGEVTVLALPEGPLKLRTGDVAIRLGTSRQIAVGTFPLPRAREHDEFGFVTKMDRPGASNDFTIFRRFFSQPQLQPTVKALLGPNFKRVAPAVQAVIEAAGPAEGHPFLKPGTPFDPVFYTVLDRYLDAAITRETVATRVGDEWETEELEGELPAIDAPEDSPGELAVFDVKALRDMRGADIDDLARALAARREVQSLGELPSPYDLDLNDAEALDRGLPYWPGTPFLSHVGMVVVEEVGQGEERRAQAFVYDAYPGEGIVRKSLDAFFGEPEAAIGAVFRLRDGDPGTTGAQGAPGLAAAEVVELYRRRLAKKTKLLGRPSGPDPASEVLLASDEAAPPPDRAQAWDSFDYAFDWRNQTRYSCSELVWSHYARNGVVLSDSFSMLLAPVPVARDQLGWDVEVLIQASPLSLVLSNRLRRVVDFDSHTFDELLERYDGTGHPQNVPAALTWGPISSTGLEGPTIRLHAVE